MNLIWIKRQQSHSVDLESGESGLDLLQWSAESRYFISASFIFHNKPPHFPRRVTLLVNWDQLQGEKREEQGLGRQHSGLCRGEWVRLSIKHAPITLFVKQRNVLNHILEFWVRSVKSSTLHSSHLSDLTAKKKIPNANSTQADIIGNGENHGRKQLCPFAGVEEQRSKWSEALSLSQEK